MSQLSDEFTEFYKNEIVPQIKKTLKDNNVTVLEPNAINRSYKPVVNDHILLQGQEYIGALSIILDMDKTGNNPLVYGIFAPRGYDKIKSYNDFNEMYLTDRTEVEAELLESLGVGDE